MRLSATLVLLSCIGLLGGCANPRSLVVGQSTADLKGPGSFIAAMIRIEFGQPRIAYTYHCKELCPGSSVDSCNFSTAHRSCSS